MTGFYGQQTGTAQFRAQFGLLWLLPGSLPRPSGWRLQMPLNRGVTPWCHSDDGQLNLPSGGHAELPGRGQRDYFL